MHELFVDPMFNSYQEKLIKELNSVIICMLAQNNFEEVKGAMRIINKIIKFPEALSKSDDVKECVRKNIGRFQSNWIKEAIEKFN